MYQDGPGPVGRKNVRYVRWNQPLLGSPYNSGGARSHRVHRPGSRRLGGVEATGASPGVAASRPHRSDPRAGPVRRTPCARGAWGGERAGGLGLRLACPRELRTGAGTTDLNEVVRPRVSAGFPRDATGKKGYQIHSSAMLLEQATGRPQKSEKSFALATNASRRRSDRACPSLEEADVFSAMKLRPFPARISETVRNIDRAR